MQGQKNVAELCTLGSYVTPEMSEAGLELCTTAKEFILNGYFWPGVPFALSEWSTFLGKVSVQEVRPVHSLFVCLVD
jgi:hypothetical protein